MQPPADDAERRGARTEPEAAEPEAAVPMRSLVTIVVLSCILAGLVGGIAGALAATDDDPKPKPDRTSVEYILHHPRTPYTPVATGKGLTIAATWTGNFSTVGKLGVVSITGTITGDWSGAGFLELSLPKSWVAQPGIEAAVINAWMGPKPSLGLHYGMTGVVHPGSRTIRFIAPSPSSTSTTWLAVDGVKVPTHFTGDADPSHQDEFHAVGWVLLG